MGKLEELYEPVLVEDGDDVGSNPSSNTPLAEIAQARLDRRAVLRGFVSATVAGGRGRRHPDEQDRARGRRGLPAHEPRLPVAPADDHREPRGGTRLHGAGADPLG